MNNKLIERVIRLNNEAFPPLIYQNPVLDRNVASALSKSFISILKVCRQNSNINSNLQVSLLENIRSLCKVEQENHFKVDDNFTELLTEVYQKNIKESTSKDSDETDQMLDGFLLRRFKGTETSSRRKFQANPEVVQALTNLDENGTHLIQLSQEIIHWDANNKKIMNILKDIWNNKNITVNTVPEPLIDEMAIKMKGEIERILLKNCYKILENKDIDMEVMFTSDKSNESLLHLVKMCSVSPECFQVCCSILNYVFVTKNFDQQILGFISTFLNYVKLHTPCVSISALYPTHLSSLVLLLDVNIEELPRCTKESYVNMCINHLKSLHNSSENEFILILSHFSYWFDVYFESLDK